MKLGDIYSIVEYVWPNETGIENGEESTDKQSSKREWGPPLESMIQRSEVKNTPCGKLRQPFSAEYLKSRNLNR